MFLWLAALLMSLTSGMRQGCPGLCSHKSCGGLWSGGLVCSWSCRLMARWSLLWAACSTSRWLSGWSSSGGGLAWNGVFYFLVVASGLGFFQEKMSGCWCHKCCSYICSRCTGTRLVPRTPGGIESSFCTMLLTCLHLCIGMFATANRPFGFPSWQSSWCGIQNWVHCPHIPRDPFHKVTSVAWLLHFHPSCDTQNLGVLDQLLAQHMSLDGS